MNSRKVKWVKRSLIIGLALFSILLSTEKIKYMLRVSGKANYPVTRLLGWQNSDIKWKALDVSAKIEGKSLNLTNSHTYIAIEAKVKAETTGNRKIILKKIFINQRYINKNDNPVGLIEVSPIFAFRLYEGESHNNSYDPALQSVFTFEIDIKESIQSRTWGKNYYQVKFGEKIINLETHQKK